MPVEDGVDATVDQPATEPNDIYSVQPVSPRTLTIQSDDEDFNYGRDTDDTFEVSAPPPTTPLKENKAHNALKKLQGFFNPEAAELLQVTDRPDLGRTCYRRGIRGHTTRK